MAEQGLFKIKDDWNLEIPVIDENQIVNYGSNLLCGNGYLGYRGTLEEWGKEQYKACIVTDTYDMADGKWRELSNAPDGLYARVTIDGKNLAHDPGSLDLKTKLNFNYKYGIFERSTLSNRKENSYKIYSQRFASYDNLHLIANQYILSGVKDSDVVKIKIGIEGDVWDLNGTHLKNFSSDYDSEKNILYIKAETVEEEIELVTALSFKIDSKIKNIAVDEKEKALFLIIEVDNTDKKEIKLQRNLIIYSSNDTKNPLKKALEDAENSLEFTYDELLEKHKDKWDQKWEIADIEIKGNLMDQLALRFNLYHNIIATPTHSEYLPIGARGLSCQAYQGAAFWDQEIFNLPMFMYTDLDSAKNILKYRYHTLDGARKKAKDLGYDGAFYAWISGKSGKELCPSFFFKDVISGRKIRNHFNDWQIHVSPDISYSIWKYYLATDDINFISKYGAEILFEIARFIHSRVHFNQYKGQYEVIRLLGPDEYHENVDNNAFTNYQCRFALKIALYFYFKLKNESTGQLEKIVDKIDLNESEITAWQEIKEKIYLPKPDPENKLIEQFDGYFDLEDTTAEVLRSRLIDKSEYWGWPNGVAVFTQVIKQADVIQLFTLHDIFSEDVITANYDYYEKRTQHGSSLSPSQYAVVAARLGRSKEAYRYFTKSAYIDLKSSNKAVSGGTFIGGVHTAAAGGVWQVLINGFAGMILNKDGLLFKPNLPEEWDHIKWKLIYKKAKLKFKLTRDEFLISSDKANKRDIEFKVFNKKYIIEPGEKLKISL
ncbi:glycosyl hydrolase family 65 protein [Halanaerobium hydrogeniformans]|uniref:Glycoside hydrolase family 65 central catalytic n=1 Tax=Halanaerobium hydrogeniformans TaxID=656519 RepID=E4RIU0_HALHG|nr:glycosyl hydrolase family 65 protein [Halanaerobium hydrogeniformans]ADQ15160.1 glycoside hydrolase family 65 central catalytic [Halanaerobium hydrogeniformans]